MISALPLLFAALVGTPVEFTLPSGGTYLVSLAVVEKEHPERIVSTFVAGEAFDSTVSNRYTVSWNGLDENFMPVPPGEYGLKGIYSPATVWPADGKPHAISARWAGGPDSGGTDPGDSGGTDPGEYVAVNMSLSVKSWCDILRAE